MRSKNLKAFLLSAVGSVSVWWSVNALSASMEEFFLTSIVRTDPAFLGAQAALLQLERKLHEASPLLKKGAAPLEIEARAAIALYGREHGSTKVLFEKESETPLPIASITKLMSALVALKTYAPQEQIVITPEIMAIPGEAGFLRPGEVFTVRDLLYLTLMESSNRATAALASPIGSEEFVRRMNEEAASLGLLATTFFNPTGLDEMGKSNVSSAADLAQLALYMREEYPQIFDILGQEEFLLRAVDGRFHHLVRNTNELLSSFAWPRKIFGGKTGTTNLAKETLLFLVESPDGKGYLITVLLGSQDKFVQMRQLLNWILESYQWKNR